MILKFIFDRLVALIGLLILWPVLLVVAILVKVKMPGGPAFFVQKRVGKDGKLFNCHNFLTMTVKHNGSTVSVAGDSRITPLGARLRHYKLDELPGLWDVLVGMMDQELAVWYNDNVIYPDKVRLNCYYYRHYSFIKDIQMILCTVLGRNMEYAGEVI
jgi:lipopolysaccharide/colanic/teichoic acid biosynthesis glycosyltransferase